MKWGSVMLHWNPHYGTWLSVNIQSLEINWVVGHPRVILQRTAGFMKESSCIDNLKQSQEIVSLFQLLQHSREQFRGAPTTLWQFCTPISPSLSFTSMGPVKRGNPGLQAAPACRHSLLNFLHRHYPACPCLTNLHPSHQAAAVRLPWKMLALGECSRHLRLFNSTHNCFLI